MEAGKWRELVGFAGRGPIGRHTSRQRLPSLGLEACRLILHTADETSPKVVSPPVPCRFHEFDRRRTANARVESAKVGEGERIRGVQSFGPVSQMKHGHSANCI